MSGGECAARGPLLGMGSPRDRPSSAGALAIETRLIGPDRVVGTMCRPVDVNAPFYQPLVAGLVDGQGLAQRRSVERQLDRDAWGDRVVVGFDLSALGTPGIAGVAHWDGL